MEPNSRLIRTETRVLDHGFVKLIDHMGDDLAICDAARVSLAKGRSFNDNAIKTPKQNKRLINYLLSHGHTSPFEQVEFKFAVKLPILVARQWMRHRTWSYNEISGRYTELPAKEMYIPARDRINYKSDSIKQGRGAEMSEENKDTYLEKLKWTYEDCLHTYQIFLEDGPCKIVCEGELQDEEGLNVSREIARLALPVGQYTQMYAKVDLNNFLKFCTLRLKPNAQYEIRVYAQAMLDLVRPIVPLAVEAWEKHVFHTVKFNRDEKETLREALTAFNNLLQLPDHEGVTERLRKKVGKLIKKLGNL